MRPESLWFKVRYYINKSLEHLWIISRPDEPHDNRTLSVDDSSEYGREHNWSWYTIRELKIKPEEVQALLNGEIVYHGRESFVLWGTKEGR